VGTGATFLLARSTNGRKAGSSSNSRKTGSASGQSPRTAGRSASSSAANPIKRHDRVQTVGRGGLMGNNGLAHPRPKVIRIYSSASRGESKRSSQPLIAERQYDVGRPWKNASP
jgi:hypothetical protein